MPAVPEKCFCGRSKFPECPGYGPRGVADLKSRRKPTGKKDEAKGRTERWVRHLRPDASDDKVAHFVAGRRFHICAWHFEHGRLSDGGDIPDVVRGGAPQKRTMIRSSPMVVQQPGAGMQQGSQAGSDRARAQQLQAALKAAAEATRPVARRKSGPPPAPEQAWPKQGAKLLAGHDRAWHSGTVNRVEITHGAKALLHVDYDGALPRLPLDLKAADTYRVPHDAADGRER